MVFQTRKFDFTYMADCQYQKSINDSIISTFAKQLEIIKQCIYIVLSMQFGVSVKISSCCTGFIYDVYDLYQSKRKRCCSAVRQLLRPRLRVGCTSRTQSLLNR